MGHHSRITILNLKNLRSTQVSPNLRIPQGVQAEASFSSSRIKVPGLLTSFGIIALLSGVFFSNSAYAAYSASISRTSSGTITLSDSSGGSIKPSSTGTLGTGSDVITVSSNCSAGYNLYVSAISGGSTNLTTSGGLDYIPSTTAATGSEATLSKDTWGIGKNDTTFSRLPAYTTDVSSLTPLYTGAGGGGNSSQNYTIYYGVNVSTAKTPGIYTGDVLYTVLMNGACLEYTLKFDSSGATASNLPDQTISFGQTVDLSEYSTTEKISKTGYHLSGWKIKDGDGTLLPISNNTSLDDGESSELTLIAEWEANTYTITYNAGTTGGTCNVSYTPATYDQNVTLSDAKCTKTNYDQTGWSINQDGSTKDYTLGQTLTKPNLTTENNGSFPLYPYFESAVTYMQDWTGCNNLDTHETVELTDVRDNQTYKVRKLRDGKCWMVENLALGKGQSIALHPSDSNVSADFTLTHVPVTMFDATRRNVAYIHYEPKGATDKSGAVLSQSTTYYSFYSATEGFSYRLDGKRGGTSSYDTCAKGWRLPDASANNDFVNLVKAYGGTGGTQTSSDVMSALTDVNGPWLIYSGSLSNPGGNDAANVGEYVDVGTMGLYWTSTNNDTYHATTLRIDSPNSMYPSIPNGKHAGWAVRCISAP